MFRALIPVALSAGWAVIALAGCTTTATSAQAPTVGSVVASVKTEDARAAPPLPPGLDPFTNLDPFPSTYQPRASRPTAIVNATILTAAGPELAHGVLLMSNGKVVAVGQGLAVPNGYDVIDAKGGWVTPGLIDPHSHLGVYPSPEVQALSDGNEATDPDTAQVWAEHSVWPQDPGFSRALAGGVTTLQIFRARQICSADAPWC